MKIAHGILCSIIAIGTLSAPPVQAGSTVVLEGFESGFTTNSQGMTNIAPFIEYGTRNGTPVAISIYTATGPGDPRVTQGTNSAKIVFPTDGFGNDFGIALSDLACSMIENAASSNQPGRYIVRYDVILENVNLVSFFNQHWLIANDWDYVRTGGGVQTNYEGEQFEIDSFSVAVELPGVGMPTNPPDGMNSADFTGGGITGLTGFCSDQFEAVTEPLTNFTIYIDNIRLIDTYDTPTDIPTVYPLQSFEGMNGLGGATSLNSSTTLSNYTTNGLYNPVTADEIPGACAEGLDDFIYPESSAVNYTDFTVTDGTNSLEVVNTAAAGYTYDAISIPFAGTPLQQIISLNLTPAQLAHYTIRWDVTTPFVPFVVNHSGSDGDYSQLDYNATTGSILPMSTGRRQSDGQESLQRETYSLTLDQILYWGVTPSLAVSTSIANNWPGDPFYFDNFIILDTAPKYTYITSSSYNAGTRQMTLVWLSDPSQTYTVQFSSNLTASDAGFTTTLATGIPSGGFYTTNTVSVPVGQAGYLRISAQ
jgi:hypothetical protein